MNFIRKNKSNIYSFIVVLLKKVLLVYYRHCVLDPQSPEKYNGLKRRLRVKHAMTVFKRAMTVINKTYSLKLNKHISFFVIIHFFILLFYSSQLKAEQNISPNIPQNIIANSLVKSWNNPGAYEVSQINFVGNTTFSQTKLLEIILSQQTNRSMPNRILTTYYFQSKKNESVPQVLVDELRKTLQQFEREYKFFNAENANIDVLLLENLYKTNGFHNVNVHYRFKSDSINSGNILTFYIEENIRHTLSAPINYIGLENLPREVQRRIDSAIVLQKGDFFSEERIENEIRSIHNILQNRGFMYANWDRSNVNVVMDMENNTDSVAVYFHLGDRIRIGNIIFIDSTYGQQVLANSTKKKQIRFAEGEYYNRGRIERSIGNLLSFGVFSSVTIDTLQREYAEDEFVRDFVITSKYRRLRDWEGSLFLNKTQIDNLVNTGAEASILHRNMFGSAQLTRLFANFSFKDVERAISSWELPDYEFRVGFSYSQPQIWRFDNARVALSTSLSYSIEILSGLFRVSKISFPIAFPTRLSWTSYFSNLNVEFNIDREVPLNFREVESYALDSAKTAMDTVNVNAALWLYRNIDNYLNESSNYWFTSNLFSVSLIGDDRDNLFSPTRGSLTYFGVDGFNPVWGVIPAISGGAKYFRFQASHSRFWRLSSVTVLGIKGKLGLTYLLNTANNFVPQERQFFSGGANSVRGWSARELRYSHHLLKGDNDANLFDFANNYIGSRTLLEGSIEFRRKLSDLPGLSENIAWIFNDLGLGFFLDFGNAFGWYYEDDFEQNTVLEWTDYFTKLAVSVGIGIRYDTFIGPIRFDFATPIHDPLGIKKPFRNLAFVFGIGHAF